MTSTSDCCSMCEKTAFDCDCCSTCEKTIDNCDCCSTCEKTIDNCDCCLECQQTIDNCDCCSECEKTIDNCDCCSECEKTIDNCDCCSECQQSSYDCDCCANCDELQENCICPCDCGDCSSCMMINDAHTEPPWELRGILVNAFTSETDWEKVWGTIRCIDPIQSAADFYLLEAACGNALIPIAGLKKIPETSDEEFFKLFGFSEDQKYNLTLKRDKIVDERRKNDPIYNARMLLNEAEIKLNEYVDNIIDVLVNYSHMAIGGELRHHTAIGGTVLSSGSRNAAWCGWKTLFDKIGPQLLQDAIALFMDFNSNSYGGEAWANCANVLYEYLVGQLGPNETINKRMFVDRVWTLQHNGGSFLNKVEWPIVNNENLQITDLSNILDMHASNPPNYHGLMNVASEEVRSYLIDFCHAMKKVDQSNEMIEEFVNVLTGNQECCEDNQLETLLAIDDCATSHAGYTGTATGYASHYFVNYNPAKISDINQESEVSLLIDISCNNPMKKVFLGYDWFGKKRIILKVKDINSTNFKIPRKYKLGKCKFSITYKNKIYFDLDISNYCNEYLVENQININFKEILKNDHIASMIG